MIDMDNFNNTYQDIITTFLLNTMLHHVGILWTVESHEQLQYDMYNTSICKPLHGKVFEGFIRN